MNSKSSVLGITAEEFRDKTGTVSIFDTIVRQEPWQRALEAMARIGETTPAEDQPKRKERLIWRIQMEDDGHDLHIQPILQKSTRKGWTRGRNVAIKRLHEEHGSMDFMTDHDRRVCQAITVENESGGSRYYGDREIYRLNPHKALPALVDHPCVFWENGDMRIDVVLSGPQLQVIQEDKGLHVSLTPSMIDRFGNQVDYVALRESPTRLAIIMFSPEHRRIADIVGPEGVNVPKSGKDSLLQAIAAAS